MASDDRTDDIQGWIDRLHTGGDPARAALIACASSRLTRLARKMLKGYSSVARWEQTDDVLQNALIRLDRALKNVTPPSTRDFFRLAAAQIRRELIDLARRHYGPEGLGAHHSTRLLTSGSGDPAGGRGEPAESTLDPSRLAAWTEFHIQIGHLPEEERELFDLLWYQDLTQSQAAQVLSSRTWFSLLPAPPPTPALPREGGGRNSGPLPPRGGGLGWGVAGLAISKESESRCLAVRSLDRLAIVAFGSTLGGGVGRCFRRA